MYHSSRSGVQRKGGGGGRTARPAPPLNPRLGENQTERKTTPELKAALVILRESFHGCKTSRIQARRKQFRVGLAKVGSSADGASIGPRGSGGMYPRKHLKFSFSRMHIWRIIREN